MLCNQLANFREKVVRNIHYGCGAFDSSLILRKRVVFILSLVTGKDSLNFLFVPACWKLVLLHGCFFFLRLR